MEAVTEAVATRAAAEAVEAANGGLAAVSMAVARAPTATAALRAGVRAASIATEE